MDETIEEGLNFLRSGCKTYVSDAFPITLGKRLSISKESLLKTDDKRIRKSPERMGSYEEESNEPPKKKRRISKSPKRTSKRKLSKSPIKTDQGVATVYQKHRALRSRKATYRV
eukprot:TRINITY_DN108456_c0_g1_i1.p4 TRINITY_DN108456_c0_g1~~TRINITY_DN108456_c0_g1_i1.p4  ORF type:complete len:114 (+),score=12.09 TRINITY_DN108456_c0_g1_i1:3-344(+)